MKSFENFIILEKLGINIEVINISNIIYNQLIKNPKSTEIILPYNKLNIKKIIITHIQNGGADLNIDKSTNDVIYLNVHKITKDIIQHELNHALQLIKQGNSKIIKKITSYKAHLLMKNILPESEYIENLLAFKYFSQKYEMDSYVYNIKQDMLELFDNSFQNLNYKNYSDIINNNFNVYYKHVLEESKYYKTYQQFLINYEPNTLNNMNNDELLLLINIVEDNYIFLIKQKNKLSTLLKSFYQILFKNNYINNVDIKITNIDKYINSLKSEKNTSVTYFNNKISKLYDIIRDEIIEKYK